MFKVVENTGATLWNPLEIIEANAVSTLREPRNLRYAWGESATVPGVYHFQESFVGKQGFENFWLLILLDRRKNFCLQFT